MDYIKIRFGDDFDQLGSRFEETIENVFQSIGPMFSLKERLWKPSMDVYETREQIVVIVELAGVDEDSLEIEVSSKALKINGFRNEVPKMEVCKYRLAEIQYGKFERVLILPSFIDPDKVEASCQNGFLRIHLAKKPREKSIKVPIAND